MLSGSGDPFGRSPGSAGAQFDRSQVLGFQLYVQSLADVKVTESPAEDAFARPISLSRDLLGFDPLGTGEHRAHVQGVVTMQWPGHLIFLSDASGAIRLQTRQAPVLRVGERVEAVGFRSLESRTPQLHSAVVRTLGMSAPPDPVGITPAPAVSRSPQEYFQARPLLRDRRRRRDCRTATQDRPAARPDLD